MTDEDVGRFAVHRFDFPGVDIKSRQMRWYPDGALAVHALGYVSALSPTDLQHVDAAAYAGTLVIGKLGVEAAYEKRLHGTNGYREILVNAQGRSVEKIGSVTPQLRTQSPVSGDNLVLGLDLAVQKVAEDALGAHREITLLDRGEPARQVRTTNRSQRVEDHRLRHPVEVVRRGRAPPSGHVDADERGQMIVEVDPALAGHVETCFQGAADDVTEPSGTGFIGKRPEPVEPLRHVRAATPVLVEA